MHQPMLLLLFSAAALLKIIGACSSRSTPRPRPPPPPTARPHITFETYVCPEAYAKWYCLNGATCFSVKIGESILYNCECADGFVGQRCEFKDLEGSYLAVRHQIMIETASIAGGVTLLIIILIVVSIAVYVHYKKRKEEQTHPVTSVAQTYKPFSAFYEADSHIQDRSIHLNDPDSREQNQSTVHSASQGASAL